MNTAGDEQEKCFRPPGSLPVMDFSSGLGIVSGPMEATKIPQTFCQTLPEFCKAVQDDIWWCEALFTIREAVKLPLMWKLWSHKDVNRLQKTTRRPGNLPARCAGMGSLPGFTVRALVMSGGGECLQ